MRIEDFNERLKRGILVADGAMGSMLYESAAAHRCLEELNASHEEVVFRVHQAYIEAGAQVIETNTFGANRHKLGEHGMGERVAEQHEVLIAGSIGPLGIAQHVRDLPDEEMRAIFKEQAGALEERGVDFFILETFSDIEELIAAIEGIR